MFFFRFSCGDHPAAFNQTSDQKERQSEILCQKDIKKGKSLCQMCHGPSASTSGPLELGAPATAPPWWSVPHMLTAELLIQAGCDEMSRLLI